MPSPTPPRDEPDPTLTRRLLGQARKGDKDAERALFDTLRGTLSRECDRHPLMEVVRRSSSTDDVVQEVWLRCCAGGVLSGYADRGPGSLQAFLGVILDRTLVDMVRRAGRLKRGHYVTRSLDTTAEGERAYDLPDGQPTPGCWSRARELLDLCREVLAGKEWECWRLAEVDGLDSEDIGRRLGCSAAAVRGLLFRARQRLVLELGRRYDPGGNPPSPPPAPPPAGGPPAG